MGLTKSFPLAYTFTNFIRGLDNVSPATTLKQGALADCKNFNITRQGKLSKRAGCAKKWATACGSSANVNTIYEYKSPGGTYVSTYVLVASGTVVYSYYNSTWNSVKTGLTTGLKHSFVTHLGICYAANGTDNNFKIYSDGSQVNNATAYGVGISPPAAAPTVAADTAAWTAKYTSTNTYFKGLYDFVEFSSKLTVLDVHDTQYHGSVLASADGATWAEVYEIADTHSDWTTSHNFNDLDGRSVAVYDSKFWFNLYDDNVGYDIIAGWDGSTGLTVGLATETNRCTYGLTLFDDKLFCISDVTPSAVNARDIHSYNGTSWTTYGVDLAYNKADANSPENDIKHRTTQLFEYAGDLWFFATYYNSSDSKWGWRVYKFNLGTYTWATTATYDSSSTLADDYCLSAVWLGSDDETVYVLGNKIDANGAANDDAKIYKALNTDLDDWEAVATIDDLGFCYGNAELNDVQYFHVQENTANYSKIFFWDEAEETMTQDGSTVTTNVSSGECGAVINWGDRLYFGKYKTLYQREDVDFKGTYYYKTTYYRQNWKPFEGNPSSASSAITATNTGINVTVAASTDGQVNKIRLYRTQDGGSTYYHVTDLSNSGQTYTDTTADSSLTTGLDTDNTVPPKAKYLVLHKDRVIYINCPDETDGTSKVMWSKAGYGDAVPSTNYQFFDRNDGEDITGGASIGDYLIIFKRNKIAVLAGNFDESAELWVANREIGCLSHHTIIPFEDKVMFLSEEGWKAFDGRNIYSMSEYVNGWQGDAYFTSGEAANYQSVYYSAREQFMTLMKHSSATDIVAVGHLLMPLLQAGEGSPEYGVGMLAGWTYHQYDNEVLTTLGTYTDSDNITRVLAGDDGGWIYELDTGTQDITAGGTGNIAYTFQTDWSALGTPNYITKTCRRGYLTYTSSTTDNMTFNIEKDFSDTDDTQTLACVTSGVGDADLKKIHLSGTGEVFRLTISGTTNQNISIIGLDILFRQESRA